MNYRCPRCDHKNKFYGSRYAIWQCENCLHKFRGIHCDINTADFFLTVLPIFPQFWINEIDIVNRTYCPFCRSLIQGRNGKSKHGYWPSVCVSCHKDLPIDEYFEEAEEVVEEDYLAEQDLPFMEKYKIE